MKRRYRGKRSHRRSSRRKGTTLRSYGSSRGGTRL